MKKFFYMIVALMIGIQLIVTDSNVAEARQDYYCGYDEQYGCDLYIDIDSVRATGNGNGYRKSEAHMYWTNGASNPYGCVVYGYKDGIYNFSGGAGGYYVPTGARYNFCVICDKVAYQ